MGVSGKQSGAVTSSRDSMGNGCNPALKVQFLAVLAGSLTIAIFWPEIRFL